jgi:tripartite-type tricarboxylate transporter receptor subunit TctC
LALLALAADLGKAAAQANYPSRAITFLVPMAAGSGSDAVARVVAQHAQPILGQPMVVENVPGAGGQIGTARVARADPDGYTVLLGSVTTHAANKSLFKKLSYDPVADFEPVAKLGTVALALVANPSVPATNVRELIEYAKSHPGELSFGAGSASSRVAGEMFKSMAGVDMLYVPYKGNPQAMTDLLGGHVSLVIADFGATLPHIRAGKLKALAVTSAQRVSFVPDLPTMSEAGLPGYELTGWLAAYVPKGTPKSIVDKLNATFTEVLASKDAVATLNSAGIEATPSTPDALKAFAAAETEKWAKVVKEAGIEPE